MNHPFPSGRITTRRRLSRTVLTALLLAAPAIPTAVGCTAAGRTFGKVTGSQNANLQTGIRWISSIPELKPAKAGRNSVYLNVRDLTASGLDLAPAFQRSVAAAGYTWATDPDQAAYRLRATIRFAGMNDEANEAELSNVLGSGVFGLATGTATSVAVKSVTGSGVAGGVVGLGAGVLTAAASNNYLKTKEYAVIVDLALEEYVEGGVDTRYDIDRETTTIQVAGARIPGGSEGSRTLNNDEKRQSSSEVATHREHALRFMAWARQTSLHEHEAVPPILAKLETVLGSVLPPVAAAPSAFGPATLTPPSAAAPAELAAN